MLHSSLLSRVTVRPRTRTVRVSHNAVTLEAGRASRSTSARARLRSLVSSGVSIALPPDVARLFWDVDPDDVDLQAHRDYVLERVMSRGGWTAMCWLRGTYRPEELADFLVRKGARLAPRELAYWCLIAGIELPSRSGGARPPWAGP
jgi:hypothetical protein